MKEKQNNFNNILFKGAKFGYAVLTIKDKTFKKLSSPL